MVGIPENPFDRDGLFSYYPPSVSSTKFFKKKVLHRRTRGVLYIWEYW